jgi:phage baseplate assembly protein W
LITYKQYTISQGDTLQAIAQDELGDMRLWYMLAQLNNLKHPYIVDTVEEKMKSPMNLATIGDSILINTTDSATDVATALATMPQYAREEIMNLALGKDLDIAPLPTSQRKTGYSGEILELKGDNSGKLALVKGVENLKQSLFLRLITPRGGYLGHPNYGSRIQNYLGNKNSEENSIMIDIEIERTLRSDARVTNVSLKERTWGQNWYKATFLVYSITFDQAFEFVLNAGNSGPISLG